jgi:hypothetical protein
VRMSVLSALDVRCEKASRRIRSDPELVGFLTSPTSQLNQVWSPRPAQRGEG